MAEFTLIEPDFKGNFLSFEMLRCALNFHSQKLNYLGESNGTFPAKFDVTQNLTQVKLIALISRPSGFKSSPTKAMDT